MKNRESLYPGRVKLTPVDAANGIYDLTRADEPRDEGTPLNKKLLDYAVAACGVTAGTATAYTLDDEFGGFELVDGAKVNFRLHVASGANPTLNVNGTGAKSIKNVYGDSMTSGIPAEMWISAEYSSSADAFILTGATPRAVVGRYIGDGTGVTNVTLTFNNVTYQSATETSNVPREIILPHAPNSVVIFEESVGFVGAVYKESPLSSRISGTVTSYMGLTETGTSNFITTDLYVKFISINQNKLSIVQQIAGTGIQTDAVLTAKVSDMSFADYENGNQYNIAGRKYHYIAF